MVKISARSALPFSSSGKCQKRGGGVPLIEDKQMLCIGNNELRVHMAASVFIGALFLQICLVIMIICIFIFAHNPHWYYSFRTILVNNLSWIFEEERYSSLVPLLIVEMILTFIYMFFAFICTQFGLSNSDYNVTSRVLTHWFFEASSYLVILVAVFSENCVDWEGDLSNKYPIYTGLGILTKVSVFVSMRYAEREPNFFVHNLKVSFFKIYCGPF